MAGGSGGGGFGGFGVVDWSGLANCTVGTMRVGVEPDMDRSKTESKSRAKNCLLRLKRPQSKVRTHHSTSVYKH